MFAQICSPIESLSAVRTVADLFACMYGHVLLVATVPDKLLVAEGAGVLWITMSFAVLAKSVLVHKPFSADVTGKRKLAIRMNPQDVRV